VTEAEWLACTDVRAMLEHVRPWASGRKLWLFAACCCRALLGHVTDPERYRLGVGVLEAYADGRADADDLGLMRRQLLFREGDAAEQEAWEALRQALRAEPWDAALGAYRAADACVGYYSSVAYLDDHGESGRIDLAVELTYHLRDLFGNPFRFPEPRPFPAGVVGLALSLYEGDAALYPLLADALEDLGEGDAAEHCRRGGHVRGCHVVDWILGRG
jgi:hypothetical protein